MVQGGWSEAPHLTEKDIADLSASLSPHQLEARSKGIPSLGAGAIYPIPISDCFIDPVPLPAHFARLYALDVGWKCTAAMWGAWDRDNDCIYAYSEHYRGQAEPAVHASAIKARGAWMPGLIDPAARGRSQLDGRTLMKQYMGEGLRLRPANNAVEAGILDVYQRLATGRLRIFSTLVKTKFEYQLYRRNEKGLIVKENDHLMDCLRYLASGIKYATTKPQQQIIDTHHAADRVTGY